MIRAPSSIDLGPRLEIPHVIDYLDYMSLFGGTT